MNPCELTVTITALANKLAEGRSADEIYLITRMLNQLRDTLETIVYQRKLCENNSNISNIERPGKL